jgi:phospholipase/carboxylesterase
MVTDTSVTDDNAPIEIETGPRPVASIIWLHGLGADGYDFEPIVPELGLPGSLAVRFVFPHAPYRPVTVNGGHVMRAWYDIAMDGQGRGFRQDETHIRESEQTLRGLIAQERDRGIDSRRIVLAGFSQGAAMALHTGLRYPEPLAGILALSMPVPLPERIASELNPANAHVPVFLAHGTQDQVVPFPIGEYGHQLLVQLGLPIEWHSYPMAHTVIQDEVSDIRAWLARVLAA